MTEEFQRSGPFGKDVEPLEVYAEHTEIRRLIHDEIRKLYVTLHPRSSAVNIILEKFQNCLTPLKNLHDPGRLPVCTTVPKSAVPNKQSCVWALVSCLVQAYWEYELEDDTGYKEKVYGLLEGLKTINEHYPEMKIVGAKNKGWWLEL